MIVSKEEQFLDWVSLVLHEVVGEIFEEGSVDSLQSSRDHAVDLHLLPQQGHYFPVFFIRFKAQQLIVSFQELRLTLHVQEVEPLCGHQHSIVLNGHHH